MSESLYKITGPRGRPIYGGKGAWPLPSGDLRAPAAPGDWREVKGPLIPCRNGLHLCRVMDLPNWTTSKGQVWEAETGDEQINHGDKIVARRARLLRLVGDLGVALLRGWAVDCAEHALPIFERHYPADSRPRDCIAVTRRYLRGEVSPKELSGARGIAAAATAAATAAAVDAAATTAAAAAAAAAYAADTAAYAAATARAAAGYAAAAYAAATAAAAWVAATYASAAADADDARQAERQWQGKRLLTLLGEMVPA